eukprot:m.95148 g.95148  ORF g.95148 m.95148 type:complete len:76 (-) comp8939_c1_seq1:3988-4215(-)
MYRYFDPFFRLVARRWDSRKGPMNSLCFVCFPTSSSNCGAFSRMTFIIWSTYIPNLPASSSLSSKIFIMSSLLLL